MARRQNKIATAVWVRWGFSICLAVVLYHVAGHYATVDCTAIRTNIHDGGVPMLLRLIGGSALLILCGLPLAVCALVAGFITTPLTGAGIVSAAAAFSFAIAFVAGRISGNESAMLMKFERWATGRLWYTDMLSSSTGSGLSWTMQQMNRVPIPLTWFSAYCGATIKHLSLPSFIAGSFASTVIVVFAYSLAGGSIGCAILDAARGLSTKAYLLPVICSTLAIVLASKLQPRMSV